eukprot:CAMPEP_0116040198 /NCGR_PEP_ID=MMETSP0321-20121206/24191_1 /TAXON_ID=163516 /ORGANISM="Leptocylindrus danicus var. danicus, Strain B650" /LENGTH=546 /DNA_ID=CAMNT_0003519917 /DNA_START=427 /DNA_END=2068 /DNA_ORIENTATION=-
MNARNAEHVSSAPTRHEKPKRGGGFGTFIRLPFRGKGLRRRRSGNDHHTRHSKKHQDNELPPSSAATSMTHHQAHSSTELSSTLSDTNEEFESALKSRRNSYSRILVQEPWNIVEALNAKEILDILVYTQRMLEMTPGFIDIDMNKVVPDMTDVHRDLARALDNEVAPAMLSTFFSPFNHKAAEETVIPAVSISKSAIVALEDDSFQEVDDSPMRQLVEANVMKRLKKWTLHMRNVKVQARLDEKFLFCAILRGEIRSDVRVDFDRLAFSNLKISAGGRIDVNCCSLSLLSLVPHVNNLYPGRRFTRPFEFRAQGCTLTQDDILESTCLRNGLQNLLNRILTRYAYSIATVETVKILDSRKISCRGTALTALGVRVPFEVRSGLSISGNGHILTLPGLEVALDPFLKLFMPVIPDITVDIGFKKDFVPREALTALGVRVPFEVRSGLSISGNGHILTLPGLEVALDPFLKLFMPVIPDITVDIGPNAKIESLYINGDRRLVEISARATITPSKAIDFLSYREVPQTPAHFNVDVGEFVTNLGNFDK